MIGVVFNKKRPELQTFLCNGTVNIDTCPQNVAPDPFPNKCQCSFQFQFSRILFLFNSLSIVLFEFLLVL